MRNCRIRFPYGAFSRWWFLLVLCGGLFWPATLHASRSEERVFSAARAMFDDHQYNLAETNFSIFLTTYTNSPHVPYAILYLARARLEQSNYDGAIQKLAGAISQSGELAGEYVFWIASARLAKGQYAAAAEGFANLIGNFPQSPRRLEAVCDEAAALSEMREWPKVIALLQDRDGVFRQLAAADPKNSLVTRGLLLLGEAYLADGKFPAGEKVVRGIDSAGLTPEWQWRREYLLCRLELAGGRADQALQDSTNLLDAASGPRHLAASRFLRGKILEQLGRAPEALQAYTNNFSPDLAAEDQRQAVLDAVSLVLSQKQMQDAVQLLDNYLVQQTNGAALDLAHLTAGELNLRMHFAASGPATNDTVLPPTFLEDARTNFDAVITNFPTSPLVAQAHLDRGWCYWEESNMPPAKADFQAATDGLPHPTEAQAVARFKLADTEFYLHDYGGAVGNYNQLLREYTGFPSVTNELFARALYQIVQANLDRGDPGEAEEALRKILDWYPDSLFGDRGQLLMGESQDDYDMARRVFNNLLERSPKTPLLPAVQYAIARTYEQQGQWKEALRRYDAWVNTHTNDASALLPWVEYSRALVCGKAGMESNALALFTNFVAQFPSNNLAPWAQNWVADFYFNQGDYQTAEKNYELLYQTFPNAGDLSYQARLMAGRAALDGQRAIEAGQYFSDLVNITNAPASFVAQGYFALGDTIFQQWQGSPTNTLLLNEAITAISHLTNGAPTNALAAQAYGRLGTYYMQWADLQWEPKHDPKVYSDAVQMYQAILNFPATNVDVTTRSQAEVGLGLIAEQEDQPGEALTHYSRVLYEMDPEHFDPYWVEQAGRAASEIYERQQQWDKAVKVYERVLKAVPSLRATLDKAIRTAETAAAKAQN